MLYPKMHTYPAGEPTILRISANSAETVWIQLVYPESYLDFARDQGNSPEGWGSCLNKSITGVRPGCCFFDSLINILASANPFVRTCIIHIYICMYVYIYIYIHIGVFTYIHAYVIAWLHSVGWHERWL